MPRVEVGDGIGRIDEVPMSYVHGAQTLLFGALLFTVDGSCWSDPQPPEVGGVRIRVSPAQVAVGDSVIVTARALNRSGDQLSHRVARPVIGSSDQAVFEATGKWAVLGVARRPGRAWIVARLDRFADSVVVTVTDRP